MKRGLGKRGQFYLVAAIVLAAVIIGISAVSNYAKREKNTGLYNLKEELSIEGESTIDHGTKNQFNRAQMSNLMQNFTSYYISYEGSSGKNLYFIYGDRSNITVSGYQNRALSVSVISGSSSLSVTEEAGNFSGSFDPTENAVNLSISEKVYNFVLSPTENFNFIITQDINGGQYVVQG